MRRLSFWWRMVHYRVSIHASVKDATLRYQRLQFFVVVSIHASVKDATVAYFSCCRTSFSFNPRICKRCDKCRACPLNQYKVSIHASVKDATGSNCMASIIDCFNPRICKRCDQFRGFSYKEIIVSIHASVKDATNRGGGIGSAYIRFNPRICKRCDMLDLSFLSISETFQSTHL